MIDRLMTWLGMLLCVLAVQQARAEGPVTIGGVEYATVDPGPAFVEEPRPPQDWESPEPTDREVAAGMLVFRTQDPGEYYPERRPKKDERVKSLRLSLTPGETASRWLGFQSLGDLESVSIEVADVPGLEFEVRRIHAWPQRSTWFNSRTYQIIPEMLLQQKDGRTEHPLTGGVLEWRDFDVPEAQTVGIWINVTASGDASPGEQTTTVILTSDGHESIEVPFTVEVHPFALPDKVENHRWILYAWPNRYRSGADPLPDLREMEKVGIDGFLDNAYLMVSIDKDEDGELRIRDRANSIRWVERIISRAQQVGMRGPFGVWTTPVNRDLAKALGVDITEPWPEEMHEGVRQVKTYFDDHYDQLGIDDWMSFAADEPKPGNVYAIEAMKAWHAAGARTYCTAYTGTYAETAQWITDASIGYGDSQSRALVERHNAREWVIGDGTYIGPHEMARHRRRAGVSFFLSDAYGCAIWRWGGSHGDPFNDFDGREARAAEPADQLLTYPQMAEPNDWSTYIGPIPTIAWESIRDGINDYKYLNVLEQNIERGLASDSSSAQTRARAAAQALGQLRETFYASAENGKGKNVFKIDTPSIESMRQWAADEIIAIQTAMDDQVIDTGSAGPRDVTITLAPKLNVAGRDAALLSPPVLSIPRTPRTPRINGALSTGEWEAAARASIPASADTEARIMYDEHNVYVAWHADEPKMDRIIPADHESDAGPIWPQDSVELFIAPADARDQPAHIMINHLGRWISESTAVHDWNAKAIVAARHLSTGYIIEMALPWEALEQIAPRPWQKVALNFCRVRNVDAGEADRGKFNWAYGTGNFHQPERFGTGLMEGAEIEVLRTFSEVSEDGMFSVGAKVRNRTDRPLFAKIVKLKGRNLELSHRSAMAKDGGRAIAPGQTGRVSRGVRLGGRRHMWTFQWNPGPNHETIEVEFNAPGPEDLHAMSLERLHHVARSGDSVTISPLLASSQRGYVRVRSGPHAAVLSLSQWQQGEAGEASFTTETRDGPVDVFVELLSSNMKPLTQENVPVILLPR